MKVGRKYANDKKYHKVIDPCCYTADYRGATHSTCNLKYINRYIRSKYDYHFIIKELSTEFEGQFTCLGENTEKYITFFSSNRKRHENNW